MRKLVLAGLGLAMLASCAPRGGYYDNGYNGGYYQPAQTYYAPQQTYYAPQPRYYTPPPVVVRQQPVYIQPQHYPPHHPQYQPRHHRDRDCDNNGRWNRPRDCRS